MNFDLFRSIAGIIGLPTMTRDINGNITLDDGVKASGLGKGLPITLTGSRALTNADDGLVLVNKTSSAYTLTVPVDLRAGFSCTVIQGSTGAITVAAGEGATVVSPSSHTKTSGAGAKLELTSWDTNKYVFNGDTAGEG